MMRSSMLRITAAIGLLSAAPLLAAQQTQGAPSLSYSHVETGYFFVYGDDPGTLDRTVGKHGAQIGFSMALNDSIYAIGHYERARRLHYNHGRLGLGGRVTVQPDVDLFAEYSYSYLNADSRKHHSVRLDVGVRRMALERWETGAFVGYDTKGPNEGSGIVGGSITFHASPDLNVRLGAETHDFDIGMVYLTGRYRFR